MYPLRPLMDRVMASILDSAAVVETQRRKRLLPAPLEPKIKTTLDRVLR